MDDFIKLKEWLGMSQDNLRMYDRDIRGIYTIKDIKENDIILSIPQKYIIDYFEVKTNKLKLLNRNSHILLFLYQEMNKKNPFLQPFFNTLPKNFDHFVDFYSKEELKQLKHTSLYCDNAYGYDEKKKDMKKDSKKMYEFLQKKNLVVEKNESDFYKRYVQLKNTVDSRVFSCVRKGKETISIVPYCDLFNHSIDHNTYWYFNDEKNCFEMQAIKDIRANTEILDTYGNKSNFSLLFFYGFTIPNNPYSNVCLNKPNSKEQAYEIKMDTKLTRKIKNYDYIIDSLKKIYKHHKKNIENIKNKDILRIYEDEMNIIKNVLGSGI